MKWLNDHNVNSDQTYDKLAEIFSKYIQAMKDFNNLDSKSATYDEILQIYNRVGGVTCEITSLCDDINREDPSNIYDLARQLLDSSIKGLFSITSDMAALAHKRGSNKTDNTNVDVALPSPRIGRIVNVDAIKVGRIININGLRWRVAHVTGSRAYLILENVSERCKFDGNGSTVFAHSDIAKKCVLLLQTMYPSVKHHLVPVSEINGSPWTIAIPSREQIETWELFKETRDRMAYSQTDGEPISYWTSSQYSSSYVWGVNSYGNFYNDLPTTSRGFRPICCLNLDNLRNNTVPEGMIYLED